MLQDQILSENILSSISTLQEASLEYENALKNENMEALLPLSKDFAYLIDMLKETGYTLEQSDRNITLGQNMECLEYSFSRIIEYIADQNLAKSLHKFRYEFIPILDESYLLFYYWGIIYPDEEKINYFNKNDLFRLSVGRYIAESEEKGKYKYDVSLLVLAYNHLDYTKNCVISLLENIPKRLNYELILINHGSTDETQSYFESIKPHKQFDIKINRGVGNATRRAIEGKYFINISNDVIVMPNAIENMHRALKEDPEIAFLVPTTTAVSNYQQIQLPSTLKKGLDLIEFSKANNVYNPYRHERRTRLCNPVTAAKTYEFLRHHSNMRFSGMVSAFPDDAISYFVRRSGKKCVLAKDAFCFHHGQVTLQKTNTQSNFDEKRRSFKKQYGIDPWGTGSCYDKAFLNMVEPMFDGHIDVLGINCGMGSNSLKIKELYKEKNHNLDVYLNNVTDNLNYIEDLKGISDDASIAKSIQVIFESGKPEYHHIVLEDAFKRKPHSPGDIRYLYSHLIKGGSLFVKIGKKNEVKKIIVNHFPNAVFFEDWVKLIKD